MQWTFGQQTEPEKNRGSKPQAQSIFGRAVGCNPKNESQRSQRDVERFDFNEPAFFDVREIGQPNKSGEE